MLMLLRRMDEGEAGPRWIDAGGRPITGTGFRSTFRDWAGEMTTFRLEVAEAALVHMIHDKAQAAYEWADKPVKRRKMMEAGAGFCTSTAAKGMAKIVSMAEAQA